MIAYIRYIRRNIAKSMTVAYHENIKYQSLWIYPENEWAFRLSCDVMDDRNDNSKSCVKGVSSGLGKQMRKSFIFRWSRLNITKVWIITLIVGYIFWLIVKDKSFLHPTFTIGYLDLNRNKTLWEYTGYIDKRSFNVARDLIYECICYIYGY